MEWTRNPRTMVLVPNSLMEHATANLPADVTAKTLRDPRRGVPQTGG